MPPERLLFRTTMPNACSPTLTVIMPVLAMPPEMVLPMTKMPSPNDP
jgi:hypothetical protein